MSRRTWSGTNATKSTTTSNSRSPRAARTASGSDTSAVSTSAPSGTERVPVRPRFRIVRSMPRSTASAPQAELMMPVPPRKRAFRFAMVASLRRAQAADLVLGQLEVGRAGRVHDALGAARARDGDDPLGECELPGQRHLLRAHALLVG